MNENAKRAARKSVVVMPTLKRPEFLALSLEKLSQVPEIDQLDVRIFVDWGINGRVNDVEYVRDTYLPTAEIFQAGPHVRVLSGTWNILNALKAGYETGAEYIFLIEEDIMVRPESFFQWHWSTQESGDYFVTCGRRHGRMPLDFYSNPGTCYRREKLALVMPHINEDYFKDTEKYVNRIFPSMKGMDGTLDDGLIRKIQRSVRGKVACAVPSVACHQGFHYYDRLPEYRNTGTTVQEKIAFLQKLVPTLSREARYTTDFEPF